MGGEGEGTGVPDSKQNARANTTQNKVLHFFLPAQGRCEGPRGLLPPARPPARLPPGGFGREGTSEGEAGWVRSLLGQCMRGPGTAGGGREGGRPPRAWQHLGQRNPVGGRGVPGAAAEGRTGLGSQREVSQAVWPRGSGEGTCRWGRPCQGRLPPSLPGAGCRPGWTEERGAAGRGSGQASWPRTPSPLPGSCRLLGGKDH